MSKTTKVAVSLPAALLAEAERARARSGESRSAYFRRALEAALRLEADREAAARYIEGYRRYPETVEDAAFVQTGVSLLAQQPWDAE